MVLIVLGIGSGAVLAACSGAQSSPPAAVSQIPPTLDSTGFARVTGPQPLSFPADYGAHPDYQSEWWYYTGNLADAAGQRFGYQLTFFRRGLIPPAQQQTRTSDWAPDQVYMAHFAVTDVGANRYSARERLSRGAAGLAGAQADPFRVWLENWSANAGDPGVYHLNADAGGQAIDLTLKDAKGPILEGDRGYSQKGPERGNASMYYSLTRLETTGMITSGGPTYNVTGLSWMDHEFSTSALAPGQIGWDWFAIQLDNNAEMMLYRMRRADGSADQFTSGQVIASDGTSTRLSPGQFSIDELGTWRSPHSGATYPAGWHVEVPSSGLSLDIQPLVADQELNVSLTYWEGAVRISGSQNGKPVSGYGYVELTGYAGSIAGQF